MVSRKGCAIVKTHERTTVKGNRRLAFYQDNGSAWSLMVHGFSSVLMSEGGTVYHLVRAALGAALDKWTEHVQSLGQMADLPSRWPERHSDPKLRKHLTAFQKLNMSQVEVVHPSQAEWLSPVSLFDKIRLEMQ